MLLQHPLSLSVGPKNRITSSGYAYDAAGNMTQVAGISGSLTYDAENRLTTTSGVTYTYDGDGRRVKKSNGKLHWHGPGGEVLQETNLSGTLLDEYVFFNGKRTARRRQSDGAVFYFFSDHLGSARVVTSASGATVEESDFYPFGGERVIVDALDNNYKFTGQERDTESGLDYFGRRYYGSNLGRFTTADSLMQSRLRLLNPQGWNAYAYVLNNPLKMIDPAGKEAKIVVVNTSSYDAQIVSGAANQLRTFAKDAGLKNVSVTVTSSAPSAMLKSMFDKHTVVVNVSDSSIGTLGQMGFRNPLGNLPGQVNAINVSKNAIEGATLPATDPSSDPAEALGNVMKHEFVHTSQGIMGGHSDDPTNLMNEGMNPDYGGTLNDKQKQQLQDHYNRPNEIDKDEREAQKSGELKEEKQ